MEGALQQKHSIVRLCAKPCASMEAQDRVNTIKLEVLRQDIREGLNRGLTGSLDVEAIQREDARGSSKLRAEGPLCRVF